MPCTVHVYDYMRKSLLFKISCSKVKNVYLLEEEQILALRKNNDDLELYSIQQMTLNWRRILIERENSLLKKSQRQNLTFLANLQNQNEDEQDETFNLCKIVTFDEKVRQIYASRAYSTKGIFVALTNTKFSVYQAFVEAGEI